MKRLLFALLFVALGFAQAESKTKQWKGFERIDFKFENRNAHIVFPKNAAEGKPWVWRARFPGWHTDMDLILLDKGFHIAYADVAGLYGSPQAVAHWDKFYQFIQNEFNLVVNFGQEYNDENIDILIIPHGEYELNIQQYLYELIALAVPTKRIHPGVENGTLDSEILKKLEELSPKQAEDKISEDIDPRWNKLKNLLTDK